MGPDADVIHGGAGDDFIDGDDWRGPPTSAACRPAPDVIDGGEGRDEVGYDKRSAPVRVDLSDRGPTARPGEGDQLTGIEDVRGGTGPNVLIGDDGPNRLQGTSAIGMSDRLDGRGGDDELTAYGSDPDGVFGGAGDDVLIARAGHGVRARHRRHDRASAAGHELPSDCERASLTALLVDVRPVRVGRHRDGAAHARSTRTERRRRPFARPRRAARARAASSGAAPHVRVTSARSAS